jgi:hypothetical protein
MVPLGGGAIPYLTGRVERRREADADRKPTKWQIPAELPEKLLENMPELASQRIFYLSMQDLSWNSGIIYRGGRAANLWEFV